MNVTYFRTLVSDVWFVCRGIDGLKILKSRYRLRKYQESIFRFGKYKQRVFVKHWNLTANDFKKLLIHARKKGRVRIIHEKHFE